MSIGQVAGAGRRSGSVVEGNTSVRHSMALMGQIDVVACVKDHD